MDFIWNNSFINRILIPREPFDLTGLVSVLNQTPNFIGNYSYVYRGKCRGNMVAVKVIKLSKEPHAVKRGLTRERTIWASLEHKNVQSFLGFADDSAFAPFGALISPWCSKGDAAGFLREHGQQMSTGQRIDLWRGVVVGVAYLHHHTPVIVHGDLKPGNVVIDDDGCPRICDFGLSRMLQDEEGTGHTTTSEHTGTERYLAPELVRSETTVYPTTHSDVYALGCLGLEFVYLQKPYSHRKNNLRGQVISDLKKGIAPATNTPPFSPKIWALLQSAWKGEPSQRPSVIVIQQTVDSIQAILPLAIFKRIIHLLADKELHHTGLIDSQMSAWRKRNATLTRLCRVSRSWSYIATPYIYQDILIYSDTYSHSQELLLLTQSLALRALSPGPAGYENIIRSLTLDIYGKENLSTEVFGKTIIDFVDIAKLTPALQSIRVTEYITKDDPYVPYVPIVYSQTVHSPVAVNLTIQSLERLSQSLRALQKLPSLLSLDISTSAHHTPGNTELPLPLELVFANLQHLAMRHLTVRGGEVELLRVCGHWSMPRLTSLSIKSGWRHDRGGSSMQRLLGSCGAKLLHLSLDLTYSNPASLASVLRLCPCLQLLVFSLKSEQEISEAVNHTSLKHLTLVRRERSWIPVEAQDFRPWLIGLQRSARMQFPSLKEIMVEFRTLNRRGAPIESPLSSAYFRTDENFIDHWDTQTICRYVEGTIKPRIMRSSLPLSLSLPYYMQVPSRVT